MLVCSWLLIQNTILFVSVFLLCHEYAHLLLHRAQMGHVSKESERANLFEVRANVFAACFLMPDEGIRQFVAGLGKGNASRLHADIFDEAGVVPMIPERRAVVRTSSCTML